MPQLFLFLIFFVEFSSFQASRSDPFPTAAAVRVMRRSDIVGPLDLGELARPRDVFFFCLMGSGGAVEMRMGRLPQ
jgi:hypothetical protein